MSALNPQYPDWDGLSANSARSSRSIDAAPNFQDWDRLVSEVLAIQAAVSAVGGGDFLQITENLADLDDASAARTNLGLGTMAVETAADYYTAAEVDTLIAGVGGGASLEVTKTNDNAGSLTIGMPVYAKANGNVDKARANAISTSEVLGLAAATIATTASGGIQTAGTLTATTGEWDAVTGQTGGLTPGSIYYLDPATAGLLTTTAPTTAGQVRLRVGLAHSTTELEIRIGEPILL